MESGIYAGTLRHRRLLPKAHEFRFPLFMVLADIDELPGLMRRSRLSSYNRWNWAAYHERDHFGDPNLSLRQRLEKQAAERAVALPKGRIFLLTHLRYLGYTFNPVSFFYCCGSTGECESIVAEVSNTFGETENYWLTPEAAVSTGPTSRRYRFDKTFHVSPFMRMSQQYDWSFAEPSEKLIVNTSNFEDGRLLFHSSLTLSRREWTAAELRRTLIGYPLVTARVVLSIHWHALRLLMKSVPVVHHPGANRFTRRSSTVLGGSWKTE